MTDILRSGFVFSQSFTTVHVSRPVLGELFCWDRMVGDSVMSCSYVLYMCAMSLKEHQYNSCSEIAQKQKINNEWLLNK